MNIKEYRLTSTEEPSDEFLHEFGKNGADCYSKNGHAVTDLTRQS